jgi:hypothetical protein
VKSHGSEGKDHRRTYFRRRIYQLLEKNGLGFYEKLGMKRSDDVMQYNKIEWTGFVVE